MFDSAMRHRRVLNEVAINQLRLAHATDAYSESARSLRCPVEVQRTGPLIPANLKGMGDEYNKSIEPQHNSTPDTMPRTN